MDYDKKIKLNREQSEAMEHGEGPLLIIAGAGTGKTTVVTERIKYLISKNLAKPSEILALTFTEKASREMEERVDIALPYGVTQMWIMTFHAFGERVLRQEALQIGLDPGYRLYTEAETVIFFRKNLFAFDLNYFRPLGNPAKFIEGMLTHFNRLKDEDITPNQYIDWVKTQNSIPMLHRDKTQSDEKRIEDEKYLELAEAYQKYEELKIKEGVMDFADLISNTLKLFRTRKNILKEYQDQFKYILIDEFQDTNFAQNELAILLAGEKKNITVVGDDDQAIYRWRGAAISNIIQFRKRFPEVKIVILKQNYRSTKAILDSSYKLIQNNNPDRLEVKENINKQLIPVRRILGTEIELIYTDRVENEAEEAAKIIKKLTLRPRLNRSSGQEIKIKNDESEEKYEWKDFAILVRANNHADPFVRAFARLGIPYQFLGPGMLFRQAEVKDLIAYLKVLGNLDDSVSLYRVLAIPIIDLEAKDLAAIINFSKRIGVTLFEAIDTLVAHFENIQDHWSKRKNYQAYLPYILDKSKKILTKFVNMINRHLSLVTKETAGQILYYFLEDTGLLQKLTEYKSVKEERVAQNISRLFNKLKTFEVEHEDASVTAVVDWIDMSMELGESPLAGDNDWVNNNAVNILTVHSSKGLEFPVVFLVNLVNQRFPTIERREKIPIPEELVKEILPEGDYHEEEERRLFYVGMTRARDHLFLSAANYYGEGKRERKLSPFVLEALGEEKITTKPFDKASGKQLSLLEWKKVEEAEPSVVKQPIEYLSYSQIDTFLTCPLQYKYRYVLRIPVPPSAAGSFGTSMHMTLQKFYEKVKNRQKPTKSDLLQYLDDVWLPVGYGNKKYEEKMRDRGRRMLSLFYDKAYDYNVNIESLEQLFRIKLTPRLKLGGKIDRVDRLPDGKIEIIDYKTGRKPGEKEIRENLQMTVYALAATDYGIYNKKPEEVILSFYFFEDHEKISSTRSEKDLVKTKEKLVKTADEISKSDFQPKVGSWCDFCDFRMICEAWQ